MKSRFSVQLRQTNQLHKTGLSELTVRPNIRVFYAGRCCRMRPVLKLGDRIGKLRVPSCPAKMQFPYDSKNLTDLHALTRLWRSCVTDESITISA